MGKITSGADLMSKYCRCHLAGFQVRAAKLASGKELGWVAVVLAEEVEKHLAEHKCEPIGDTPLKILDDLCAHPAVQIPDELLERIRNLTKK